jgi:hypothetical protein
MTDGLDPAHYLPAPSLSWYSMLKYTKDELALLTDIDIDIGIGITQCSHRISNANNPYMLDKYDKEKEDVHKMIGVRSKLGTSKLIPNLNNRTKYVIDY